MSTAHRGRLRIQKLTMELRHDRNTKLVIFRNDRSDAPHLTLSWKNPRKVIDVHLKSRGTGGSEVHREIGIVQERALLKLLGTFKDRLRDNVLVELSRAAKINPGRLGRWGYAVFYMHEDEKREFIDKIAPLKKHGKRERILDPDALLDWSNSPEALPFVLLFSMKDSVVKNSFD